MSDLSSILKFNGNRRPLLNKNTLKQAQKPTSNPINLPAAPGILPDLGEVQRLEDELARAKEDCFNLQRQLATLSTHLRDARDEQAHLRKTIERLLERLT